MDKFLTRATVMLVSAYFILSYILAQFMGIDILRYSYVILFEMCVVAYTFCSGKYHCRFMRWTALSILICDVVSHTDYYFNYIPLNVFNLVLAFILISGVSVSSTLAIRHFYRISKIKKVLHERRQSNPN